MARQRRSRAQWSRGRAYQPLSLGGPMDISEIDSTLEISERGLDSWSTVAYGLTLW